MQQEAANAKQLIVERIKQSTNILVAVSTNPSVDALSAALAFSLILNKLDKHATALFSGRMPPAMTFLEPQKTFESSVDSLRDFIISLDKEKADRLRYKVENDVVKIFITPYRTVITEKDLQFSQGEVNVELIVALGVDKREDLDKAIVAHGRILHDATVVTINVNNQRTSLGAVDLHDPNVSSLCELLMSLTESFQQPGLIDAQISTALLTGIVAATERFSNEHTTPRVMTMAAQLMAAGANQQLIASNLRKAHEIPDVGGPLLPSQPEPPKEQPPEPPKPKKDGELDIAHEKRKDRDHGPKKEEKEPKQPEKPPTPKKGEPHEAEAALSAALPVAAAQSDAYNALKDAIVTDTPPAQPEPAKAEKPIPSAPQKASKAAGSEAVNAMEEPEPEDEDYLSSHSSWKGKRLEPPTLGGSLSATAEQALDDKIKAEEKDRNHTLLSHPDGGGEEAEKALNDATAAIEAMATPEQPVPPEASPAPAVAAPEPAPAEPAPPADLNAAREAVDAALAVPGEPEQPALPPLPEQPVASAPPAFDQPLSEPPMMPPAGAPDLPPPLPPLPPMPPLPTHNDDTMPPAPELPNLTPPPLPQAEESQPAQQPPAASDPGQFKIPG